MILEVSLTQSRWYRQGTTRITEHQPRSVRTVWSILALVAASVERRARAKASGRAAGVGGAARKASGGSPDCSVLRQAARSAASSGHLLRSMPKTPNALPT